MISINDVIRCNFPFGSDVSVEESVESVSVEVSEKSEFDEDSDSLSTKL